MPKPIDFCYQKGDIATPDGDWEFVSKMYFKAKELEVDEYLDYSGRLTDIKLRIQKRIIYTCFIMNLV